MRYALAIIASTFLFMVVGLLAAWGAAEYVSNDPGATGRSETTVILFVGFPLGGLVAGLFVGWIAVSLGHRLGSREVGGKPRDLD